MNQIKKQITLMAMAWGLGALASFAQLSFAGSSYKVIDEKPAANTGLNQIYVIYDTQGVTATYTATTDRKVTWMRYSNLGGGYAEEIPATRNGNTYSINLGRDDMGYIIEEGTDRYYCWVVNYANHQARFDSLDFDSQQECDRARLTFSGYADKITYYTVNGAGRELDRELSVEYSTLKYDKNSEVYNQVSASQSFAYIDQTIGVFAPLCDTRFTLTGDKYLKKWGMTLTIESDTYTAIAVQAETVAEQEKRENDNEQKVEANSLGGSAPIEVHFSAAVTDAAIFREWQMTKDQTFEVIDDRFQQLDLDYTFRDNGNTYVRFVANNNDGTCEYIGETYEVFVGSSNLLCPNAFSPNGDGVNDEWKVSYRSIVEYECHIFNRWGQEMLSTKDPAQGWDGRFHGKDVPTGVYYYVIKAKGSDGKKYNLNGDINIIRSKKDTTAPQEQ